MIAKLTIEHSYIPGGRYPLLASAHMTIVTAKAAEVPRVIACTPPIRGEIPPATVAAAHLAGADEIWILGGVQAIAAMAIGTDTIGKVDFIAGPGNSFVAEAKRQLFGEIGIDLPAGPTEVLIVADEKADPATVATDILSQAEHGPDTPSVVITNSQEVGEKTLVQIHRQLKILPTADIASVSWDRLGEIVVVETLDEAYKLADTYASEHVQILTEKPLDALEKMSNYGALFLGEQTCVSYGDKVGNICFNPHSSPLMDSIVHRYEPCLTYERRCTVHWRSLGWKVLEDMHVSIRHVTKGEWRARVVVWPGSSRRELRRARQVGRFESPQILGIKI